MASFDTPMSGSRGAFSLAQAESDRKECKSALPQLDWRDRVESSAVNPEADLTGLLQAWSRGDAEALEQLAPLVHLELRAMARRLLAGERQAREWQPTDLLQESYVRLLDWRAVHWQSRAQFFATTARMMRRVLVDAARARRASKRGQGVEASSLEGMDVAAPEPCVDIVALEEALTTLAATNPRPSHVVELRFFGGFTVEETAEALGVSVRTVINDWNTARAWLYHELAARGPA
jgi:RNA polymerase sigma-70 factor, ECF subfamily